MSTYPSADDAALLAAGVALAMPAEWFENFDTQLEALYEIRDAAVAWYAEGHSGPRADVFLYDVADAIAEAITAREPYPCQTAAAALDLKA